MSTRKTICFTGMDSAESEKLKSLFADANRRVGDVWVLTPETDADMLIVDVDSMYGHMTWLKMHNSGRIVVALSNSDKADADHQLLRPVTSDALAALLGKHANAAVSPPTQRPVPTPAPTPLPVATPAAPVVSVPVPSRAEPEAAAPVGPTPAPAVAAPPRERMLGDFLQPGALPGPVKRKLGDAPMLVLDPQTRTYLGPAALKGFQPYAKAVFRSEDWVAVTPSELERLKAELGGVQPYARLQWLAALMASDGKIAPGYDPNQKYRLLKWPQIEREYPKHYRIATTMMKGPQLLTEIAEGSGGSTLAEVTDFVNANLATGYAEMDAPPPSQDANAAPAKGGLLGRLRGGR
jgi:hypothetical protein